MSSNYRNLSFCVNFAILSYKNVRILFSEEASFFRRRMFGAKLNSDA